MTRVFVAGDITYNSMIYVDEFFAPQPQTVFSRAFCETVGGTAAGKAFNLNRLGLDVTLHGLVGDDAPGATIRARLADEQITFLTDVDPQGTQRHVNLMADDGGRISIYVVYATFEPEIDMVPVEAAIRGSDYVALNLSNYCRRLIPLARWYNKPLWVDIHDYDGVNDYHQDFIDGADVLTLSADALPDYRAFMCEQIADGKQLVVCTHGREGSTALTDAGEWVRVPALTDYPQRDTNGAGDSFFAGVLYGHAQGYPAVQCLQLGAVVAGLCVTSNELFAPELDVDRVTRDYRTHFGS